MLHRFALALALVSSSLPSTAAAAAAPATPLRDPAAQTEFRRALEAWERGDFATAAEALDTAYAIEPQPDLLYSRAQARRMMGRCRDALVLFEAYLSTNPSAPDKVRDTTVNIDRCRAELEEATDPPTVDENADPPAPKPTTTRGPPSPDETQSPSRRWYRDPLGGALVGVGTAGLLTGALLWRSTVRADDRSARAGTYGEFRRSHVLAERLDLAATVVTVSSSALLVGGVIRWAVLAARQRRIRSR